MYGRFSAVSISTSTNSVAELHSHQEFCTEVSSMLSCCFRRLFGKPKQSDSTLMNTKRSTGTNESLLGDQNEAQL